MTSLFDWAELSVLEGHLIAASLKGALILITAAALCLSLRRASAAVRHFVWSLALTGLLALPLLSIGLPAWHFAVLPASSVESVSITQDGAPKMMVAPGNQDRAPGNKESVVINVPPIARDAKTDLNPREISTSMSPSALLRWAFVLWLAGALLVFSRLLIGTASIWWISHRAARITDVRLLQMASDIGKQLGLTRRVQIYETSRITMPLTCGLIRSAILLPADADDWPDERRQVVLLHELAHIKRWDCLTQWLGQVACAIYWFNGLAGESPTSH